MLELEAELEDLARPELDSSVERWRNRELSSMVRSTDPSEE